MARAINLLGAVFLALLLSPARGAASWADEMLARLTLEEKAGQLQVVTIRASREDPQNGRMRRDEGLVRHPGVGGVKVDGGDAREIVATLNRLQGLAKLPLLVASDFDWGGQRQAPRGITPLPSLMAIGAAGSVRLAEEAGRHAAREGRALGLRFMFEPVLDVNSNPDNPIINVRSFGEDPRAVARLGAAFIRGVRSSGVLATAKHFPGHGATAVDSHRVLPVVTADRARLNAVDLLPFRVAIEAGVDAVMMGHLAVPALDASGTPATASKRIVTGLLRRELGFRGLVVSDAMDMRAITRGFSPGEAAVRALEAGVDMVLASPDLQRATTAIVDAVRTGRLPQRRLDAAVLQVLRAKERLGLDRQRLTPLADAAAPVADARHIDRMQELADRSITLVRNERHLVPLAGAGALLHIVVSAGAKTELSWEPLTAELQRLAPNAEHAFVEPGAAPAETERLIAQARGAQAVIVSIFLPITAAAGSSALPEELAHFVRELVAAQSAVVVVSYSSPYLLRQFPAAPAYLCAYDAAALSQKAAMKALFGEISIGGRLPVSLPGLYPLGHGIMLPARRARAVRGA